MSVRLLLADEHPIVRCALRCLLEEQPDLEVLAETGDALVAVDQTMGLGPHVVVLDIALSRLGGLEVVAELAHRAPSVAAVVLSTYTSHGYVREAMRSGALGYVPKKAAVEELLRAVREAAAGRRYLSPSLSHQDVDIHVDPEEAADPYHALSLREREVLRLVAQGHTSREIGELLIISPRTVESHRASLRNKLGLEGIPDLVRYAVGRGVVSPLPDPAAGDVPDSARPT